MNRERVEFDTAVASPSSSLVHPIVVFCGIWTFVFILYSLKLSYLLIYETADFYYLYALIVGAFIIGYYYVSAVITGLTGRDPFNIGSHSFRLHALSSDAVDEIWRRSKTLLKLWAVATVVEIIVSGGIPALWLITGNSKNYADFGLHSLHGLLMSVLLACSTVSFYLYLETKQRKFAALPLLAALWFMLLITRGFLLGILLQTLFLFLSVRRVRGSIIIKMGVAVLSLVLLFGLVGDLRSGGSSDLVRSVAHPTERFPDWLPSGFLWVYLYLASPLNNLFHTILLKPTVEDFSISVTTAQLFPTVVRSVIFPGSALKQGDLVDSNLNMGTGFLGPYLDMDISGITIFCFFLGVVAGLFWYLRRKRFFLLGYAFVVHSLVLSVFYDEILFLPFLFQLVWFWYVLRPSPKQRRIAVSDALIRE